jgi:hypothetical protein
MAGRELTREERTALAEVCRRFDTAAVRLHRTPGDALRALVLLLSGGRAVTLGRHVFLPSARAGDLALLAHELTHCRQYEEWGFLRYYRRGAAEQARHLLSRLGAVPDPYDWRRGPPRKFEEYGMEQQGQLVEDAYRGDPTAREIAAMNWSTSASVVSHDAIQRTSDRRSSHT